MKKLLAIITAIAGLGTSVISGNSGELDYEQMVFLDAEDLAEAGIKEAYEKLMPLLKAYVPNPAELIEKLDNDLPSYSVFCAGTIYDIYSPSLNGSQGETWGRATYALFSIINAQRNDSGVKFYAINGGNELGGMFLTQQQVDGAGKVLKKKTDWPYLPTLEYPWYGQYHE